MFLNSMICTQGFLYWIWGMLKNTNFLERKRKAHKGCLCGGRGPRKPRCLCRGSPRSRRAPRSPRAFAQLSRRVVVHGHHLHRALEHDVALAEVLQGPAHREAALHRHRGGAAGRGGSAPARPLAETAPPRRARPRQRPRREGPCGQQRQPWGDSKLVCPRAV